MARTLHRILRLGGIISSLLLERPVPHYHGPLLWISAQAEGCFGEKRAFCQRRHICCTGRADHETATCLEYYNKEVSPLSTFHHFSCCPCFFTLHGLYYSLRAHWGVQYMQMNQSFFILMLATHTKASPKLLASNNPLWPPCFFVELSAYDLSI